MAARSIKILAPLGIVCGLLLVAWLGVTLVSGHLVFGIIVPYLAAALFIAGFVLRVVGWGRSAVPFCIPTTTGQQKSLSWIPQSTVNNPNTLPGVIKRMALEVVLFRSLFKNTKTEKRGSQLGIGSAKWLWLGGLVFHWALLVIALRHLRLFLEPVLPALLGLEAADSFLHIGIPALYLTDVLILCALSFLFLRRVVAPRVRYISLFADYFALYLLLAVAITGMAMRYVDRVDIALVKEFALSLVALRPALISGIGPLFYLHLFMVSVLFAYFPWSKLMHAGGVFFAPTKSLANNSRAVRHVNPWNHPVAVHSYAEYEDEFREKMLKVGLPVERPSGLPVERNTEPSVERGANSSVKKAASQPAVAAAEQAAASAAAASPKATRHGE